MARLTVGQKTHRMLSFLMGLGDREIARVLQQYGFDQAALDEGWALLRQATPVQLDAPPARPVTREAVERLDAWENLWFPIASAVLRRHHPEVHETVFHKLRQTRGNEVVLSVGVLVARIDALAGSNGVALATLARHGLTDEVLGEARALLRGVMQPPLEALAGAGDEEPRDSGGAVAMWSYYVQWSAIARSAITDPRLLRKLGFLRKQRGEEGAGEGDDGTEEGETAGVAAAG